MATSHEAADSAGEAGYRRYVLSELQKEVLLASVSADGRPGPIYLQPPTTAGAGEVKSGDQRLFGNAAIVAVVRMIEPGLVTRTGPDRFDLTPHGVQVAEAILNPLRRRAAEVWIATGTTPAPGAKPVA